REAFHGIDSRVEFGNRFESGDIVDLLVDPAELGLWIAPSGEGDDRRMRQVGIAQTRGQIERADDLRHADTRAAASTGEAVRHVRRRRLAVPMAALAPGAPPYLGQR